MQQTATKKNPQTFGAYHAGVAAYVRDVPYGACPLAPMSEAWHAWRQGWRDEERSSQGWGGS